MMKVPKNFKTRIGGNFYVNTPNLVVCSGTTILRVERKDDDGELHVQLIIFDSSGAQKAVVKDTTLIKGKSDDYSIRTTDNNYSVLENATGRVICKLQRCAATRSMDLDAFVLTHTPEGFFIHANPVQTNVGTKATGETYADLNAALEVK